MLKSSTTKYIIAVSCLINFGYIFTNDTTTTTDYITAQYLNATFGEEKATLPTPTDDGNLTLIEKFNKALDPKKEILSPREVQKIGFDIVANNQKFESTIIDNSCIDKLKLIGGGENSQQHLLEKIFKDIKTATGKAHAAFTFCHPTTDVTTLRNRQQAITLLTQTDTTAITTALTNIDTAQEKSLMFWNQKNPVNAELLKPLYFGQQFDYQNTLKSLNTNTLALESTNRLVQMLQLAFATVYIPGFLGTEFYLIAKENNLSFKEFYTIVKPQIAAMPIAYKAAVIIPIAIQSMMGYTIFRTLQTTGEISNHLQDILITTTSHINGLKTLSSQIKSNDKLLQSLPSLQPLADFNNPNKRSVKLNKLINMLDTNTFTGKPSFWSISGRVLATYELMKQVKDELAPIYAAAGELDMYVALANLYKSREGKEARYCMVNFIENNTTPIIDAHNFWNPFINPDVVITNTIKFDTSCPNSILTGPNTGGKSTVIGGIMLNVLMAQTFGIAPSESLTMTPFTKLNCFMNIADDIATGASLFKSEVMRAKKLLEMVQALAANELSFVIIDEVFTGTSPKEGEMAALRFAEHLGSYKNNIGIIATHYPKMVELQAQNNGRFYNHHVEILRNDDNSLNRTFKLKNGPSFFNVAFDILEEEGLFV